MPNAGSSPYGMLRLPGLGVWECRRACKNGDRLTCTLPVPCHPAYQVPSAASLLGSPSSSLSDRVVPDPPKADYFCCTVCKSCLCIYKSPLSPTTSSSSPFPPPSPVPAFPPHLRKKENKRTKSGYLENKQTNKQTKVKAKVRQGAVSPIATRGFN